MNKVYWEEFIGELVIGCLYWLSFVGEIWAWTRRQFICSLFISCCFSLALCVDFMGAEYRKGKRKKYKHKNSKDKQLITNLLEDWYIWHIVTLIYRVFPFLVNPVCSAQAGKMVHWLPLATGFGGLQAPRWRRGTERSGITDRIRNFTSRFHQILSIVSK